MGNQTESIHWNRGIIEPPNEDRDYYMVWFKNTLTPAKIVMRIPSKGLGHEPGKEATMDLIQTLQAKMETLLENSTE